MFSNMGESRTELLTWLNDLLQLNYTKIEQCGTGMIFKSIKINNLKLELLMIYLYLYNYKK